MSKANQFDPREPQQTAFAKAVAGVGNPTAAKAGLEKLLDANRRLEDAEIVYPCTVHTDPGACEVAHVVAIATDFVHDYGVSAAAMLTRPEVVRSYLERHGDHQDCHS